MDGQFTQPLKSTGAEPRILRGSFRVNGTSDPAVANSRYSQGFKFTVTRSGTGTYAVKVPSGYGTPAVPYTISVHANPDDAASWFDCCLLGDGTLNAAGRTFTVLAHRNGTALDPTGRIGFAIHFDNSTGR